jgi:glutathione-specific gamma-glutamylcyclotransferase
MTRPSGVAAETEPVPQQRLSDEALHAMLDATLGDWNGRTPLWVFGYGSLMWKPEFDHDRRVPARVFGYHRKLCLRSIKYRGTFDHPGVVAGLDRGGSCAGIAYRLPATVVRDQLPLLWEREMFMGSYAARWLRARRLDDATDLRALAFIVRTDGINYCGGLSEAELVMILRTARGSFGTSLDYLQRTVQALRADGLRDPHLERLARLADAPTRQD